jgi:hypothetical protein
MEPAFPMPVARNFSYRMCFGLLQKVIFLPSKSALTSKLHSIQAEHRSCGQPSFGVRPHGRKETTVNTVRWQLKIFLATLATTLFGTNIAAIAQTTYANTITTEANWITKNAQATCSDPMIDGAIGQSAFPASGTQVVDAYRGNYAALGLLAAGYYKNVERWATWYMNNINWPDNETPEQYATIYYYDVDANANPCTKTPSTTSVNPNWTEPGFDAQDSWAATYLTLIAAWANVDPSDAKPFISTWNYQLDAIAHAAYAMLQPSGLTGAKVNYTAQYVMDNSEVVQGLNSYVWIINNMLDPTDPNTQDKQTYWTPKVAPINAAIQSNLWEKCGTGFYCDAYGDPPHTWVPCTTSQQPNPDTNYQYFWDTGLTGEAQVWPTFAGMIENNVSAVFQNLNANCSTWATHAGLPTSATGYSLLSDSGIGLAAAISGDTSDAGVWLTKANTVWMTNHQWPWTVFDAGNAIRTANLLNGGPDPAIPCPNTRCTSQADSPK